MHHLTAFQDVHPVGDSQRQRQVLLREQDGNLLFSAQLLDQFADRTNHRQGQALRWFIHQQYRGLRHERSANGQHLLLAT